MLKPKDNNQAIEPTPLQRYDYNLRLWELGDWEALSELAPDAITNLEHRQQATLFKTIGLIQTGKIAQARTMFANKSKESVAMALLASLLNTLGKVKALQGDRDGAVRHFIESAKVCGPDLPVQLYKARIRQQIEPLGIDANQFLSSQYSKKSALTMPNTMNLNVSGDFSFGLWIKLHSWPNDWMVIAGKFHSDTENEFCLRIKNQNTAQLYFGQGDKAVVLHTWNPGIHFSTNQWVHIAVVRKLDKLSRLYINGIICAERDITGLKPAKQITGEVELLGDKTSNRILDATIQHPWITNTALTSQEVRETLAASGATLTKAGYYSLAESALNLAPLDALEQQQIARVCRLAANRVRSLDYRDLIDALEGDTLTIVVVGANDGKNNDPIYEHLKTSKRKNTVVLIEPQQQLIPYLIENYRFHPNKHIVNAAVGQKGLMILYGIKQKYWKKLDVPYAAERGWPEYRAPTGVTSASKAHVAKWLKKHLPDTETDDAIEEFAVHSQSLESVLQEVGVETPIDVLQIDTEGFDDEVIYASNIQSTSPKIIFFETVHLSESRQKKLRRYLQSKGYVQYDVSEDSIALLMNS